MRRLSGNWSQAGWGTAGRPLDQRFPGGVAATHHHRQRRRSAPTLVGALAILLGCAFTATPARAIAPFTGFTCPTATQAVSNLNIVPPSQATNVVVPAGQQLTITVTNGASGTITRSDTGANVIALPGTATGTIVGPANVTLDTPNIGGGGGLFDNGPGDLMSISFSCSAVVGGFVPVGPINYGQVIDGGVALLRGREPERMELLIEQAANAAGFGKRRNCPEFASEDDFFAVHGSLTQRRVILRARIRGLERDLQRGTGPSGPALDAELASIEAEWAELNSDIDCISYSKYYDFEEDIRPAAFDEVLAGHPQLADYRAANPTGGIEAQSAEGYGMPSFSASVDAGFINSSFDAIARQAHVGRVNLVGTVSLSDDTAVSAGLNFGTGTATSAAPVSTLNQQVIGLDLVIQKQLVLGETEALLSLYGGVDHGWYNVDVGGATGSFDSNSLKIGGSISTTMAMGENYTLAPFFSGLFQYTNRGAVNLSNGVMLPASDIYNFNLGAGARLSTEWSPEGNPDAVFRPYVAAGVNLDMISGTSWGAGGPYAGIGPELSAGVDIEYGKELKMSLNADLGLSSLGWSTGASASLNFRY